MVTDTRSRTTVATAGSLTDVQRGIAEAMVVGLVPSELTKARLDDSCIDGSHSLRATLPDSHPQFEATEPGLRRFRVTVL